MESVQEREPRKIITSKDLFAQCHHCRNWVRCLKADEDGMRTIPLTLDPTKTNVEKWICDKCWENAGYDCGYPALLRA